MRVEIQVVEGGLTYPADIPLGSLIKTIITGAQPKRRENGKWVNLCAIHFPRIHQAYDFRLRELKIWPWRHSYAV